jgi:hypothetical protein
MPVPTTTVTFVSGGTTVTLPTPASGTRQTPRRPTAGIQTAGGHYGYVMGDLWYEVRLQFRRVSEARKTALVGFYHSTVKGTSTSFTYNDADGAAHTVRFLDEPRVRKIASEGDGSYDVAVRLRSSDEVV